MKSNRTTMITIWSLLALLVVICGSAGTLGLGWLWVRQWVASGTKFPIGEWAQVYVPDGARQSLVYYESDYEVGQQFMRLYMRDAYGERYYARVPSDDNEFEVGGRQGRALFRLDLEEAGLYDFRCDNPNYASDDEIPESDRVVFFKSPNTRAEVLGTRRFIIAVCGTITIAIALALYVAHGVTLTRRGHFRSRAGEAAASAVIEEAGGSP